MRILIIVIAILAFMGGLSYLLGGMMSFFSAILMLTTNFPEQVTRDVEMSPQAIGFVFILIAALMIINGLIFVVFAIGTFMWKPWARLLGIFGYALNIVVGVLTLLTTTMKGSLVPWIFGIIVAIVFITILSLAKNAYTKPAAI